MWLISQTYWWVEDVWQYDENVRGEHKSTNQIMMKTDNKYLNNNDYIEICMSIKVVNYENIKIII